MNVKEQQQPKTLALNIKEGGGDLPNRNIEISPEGLSTGTRLPKDGITNFGSAPFENDYTLAENISGLGAKHFQVYYDKSDTNYYIKDQGEGTGTFIKVLQKTVLNNGYMVSFGTYNLMIDMVPELHKPEDKVMTIKIIEGSEVKEEQYFK